MKCSAIVTGGTGGLGAAVVRRLLDDGWRVVVPWVVEAELKRVQEHPDLELVQADLFDPQAVAEVARVGAGADSAPLRGLVNLVGGFAIGGRVHETAIEEFEKQFRLNLRSSYLMTQAALASMLEHGGGSIVCVGTRAAVQPFRGAEGRRDRLRPGGGRRVPGRWDPLQRDPAERDRHAGQSRLDAEGGL
jgi:NAD(P)-dependent dehydrogenase (short-subunit alcohol dehydrogenase family)